MVILNNILQDVRNNHLTIVVRFVVVRSRQTLTLNLRQFVLSNRLVIVLWLPTPFWHMLVDSVRLSLHLIVFLGRLQITTDPFGKIVSHLQPFTILTLHCKKPND